MIGPEIGGCSQFWPFLTAILPLAFGFSILGSCFRGYFIGFFFW